MVWRRKYLSAEGWLLTSFYHQNPVSSCLTTLDTYSPKRAVKIVSDGILETNPQPLGDKFKAAMTSSMKDCKQAQS
jgi:hypothetical protein